MRYVVTSDVHLGSEYSRVELFKELISRLNPDIGLVLAGDVINNPCTPLEAPEAEALQLLIERSADSHVVWVNGNHDDNYRPANPGRIEFHQTYRIEDRIVVAHGDRFDNVMPHNRWFIRIFRFFHSLRIRLGASPVHVAVYAKKFSLLYAFLRNNVRQNALGHARESGIKAIACGHVHYVEEIVKDGIRYFNLGAWTEDPTHVLLVDEDTFKLMPTPEAMKRADWFTQLSQS